MSRVKVNAYAQGYKTYPINVAASTDNQSVGTATNTAATVALPAQAAGTAEGSWVIGEVVWSYSGAPTAGNIKIADSSGNLIDQDLSGTNFGTLVFNPPLSSQLPLSALTTTLGAAGGVTGKVSVIGWLEL